MMFIRVSGSASCYSGGGWGLNRRVHCDLLSRLLVLRVCKQQPQWMGGDTVCRLWREETGSKPQFDEPSEPESRQPLRNLNWLPRGWSESDGGEEKKGGKGGNVILKLSEKYPIHQESKKKNVLIPTAGRSLLLQSKKVINKSYNSAWNHNSL